ncbi:class I SAM-dependent methyltransferase [Egibacter rhizosphaerae]|uniref:Class I SAM-dependent methyltransferase n=1 Tax=Egibacter rhizosphaerae TaxID=1670831 RepID=A0A411YKB5_9ACTN|nr:class I SAM-dependent methyltransferase [Egibacter rhizosphaerae]QBI21642.1 class I SAM-dependent methyltransferase [Egibacter rhizosphaerae]
MGRLYARFYDRASAKYEATVIGPRRDALLADAAGTVLELGAGTGANLGRYPTTVTRLLLTEPDPHMRRRLCGREELARSPAEVLDAPAERLPVTDASVDTVVTTMVLCSVDDVDATLAEVRRVLRPGGRFLFLEHVRASDPAVSRWQDRLTPLGRRLGNGCHLNRDTLTAIRAAGFRVDDLTTHPTPGRAERLQPMVQGIATASSTEPRRDPHPPAEGAAPA